MHNRLTTALVIVVVIDAVVWLAGVLPTLRYALTHRSLPTLMGIRLLSGPFDALGIEAVIVAGLVYAAVNALKFLAAYWLWNLRLDGAVLELILLGLSAVFWYGFALPFGPPVGIIQVILIILAWKSLH